MRFSRPLALLLTAGLLIFLAAGCDSSGDDEEEDTPPTTLDGTFEATTLIVPLPIPLLEQPVNVLEEDPDNTFTMDFSEDGNVTAILDATVAGIGVEDTTQGTYTLRDDGRLTFDLDDEGDALLEAVSADPEWTYMDDVIRASGEAEGGAYDVVLERQ